MVFYNLNPTIVRLRLFFCNSYSLLSGCDYFCKKRRRTNDGGIIELSSFKLTFTLCCGIIIFSL